MRIVVPIAIALLASACASTSETSPSDSGAIDSSSDSTAIDSMPNDAIDAIDANDASDTGPHGRVATTPEDFHVAGTQIGDVPPDSFTTSNNCSVCHGGSTIPNAPFETWRKSLMGNAGRDPLFFAQLATANQDVPYAGSYCLRCHVPAAVVTGHVADPTGATLDGVDRDGVTCRLCHTMVDPLKAWSVPGDDAILSKLAEVPESYGNAQFVLDPAQLRRGPYDIPTPVHPVAQTPFVETGDFCGTCHDVGNLEVSRNADGTFAYNPLGTRASDPDPRAQFPLERTYTEWRLSDFAATGVDMGTRYGVPGQGKLISSCQDCHMPRVADKGCILADARPDLARHEFAGATAWVLRTIALQYPTEVDAAALEEGAKNAEAMVARAASLALSQTGATLHVRVTNESGHKIPTGHIEGRRIWVNVRALDASGALLAEMGAYDPATATLDEATTTVFEMKVALSDAAAAITGLPAGVTTHMALADVVAKDSRIPPRGFVNATWDAVGSGAVGATYDDLQYWADLDYAMPAGAATARVTVYYQTATPEYVEALAKGNVTDAWGTTLKSLWEKTDRSPPIVVTTMDLSLSSW